jgi:hypothetical protein
VSDNRLAVPTVGSSACMLVAKNNTFNDGSGFGLRRQFIFLFDGSDGEAERVSQLSRVANLQQPRSTRKSTLLLFTHKM